MSALNQSRRYSSSETAAIAKALYEDRIREQVEEANPGKYLVIDITSGDYWIGDESHPLLRTARDLHPDGRFYAMRIGYPAAGRMGGHARRG